MATSKLVVDPVYLSRAQDPQWALQFARIESHFFVNAGNGNFNISWDRISHISQLQPTPCCLCAVVSLVAMLIGC